MSTKVKLLLGGLIAAALLLVYFSMSQQWSGWEVYSNARYGFSVEYLNTWQLGEAPTNNDGRTFTSPDGEIECRAYGFHNALDQTLDEFIEWMQQDATTNVLEEKKTSLAGLPAVQMVLGQGDGGSIGTYSLGAETGYGVVCFVGDPSVVGSFRDVYDHMVESFQLESGLNTGQNNCQNFLSGIVTPYKDAQTFVDDQYTAVTITSRDHWDKSRLPKKVLDLESKGYTCEPMPTEFDYGDQPGDELAQPAVEEVQWDCYVEFASYEYVPGSDAAGKTRLVGEGYACEEISCADATGEQSVVWLCGK